MALISRTPASSWSLAAAIEAIDFSEIRQSIEQERLGVKTLDEAIAEGERQAADVRAKLTEIREGHNSGSAGADALLRGEPVDSLSAVEQPVRDQLTAITEATGALRRRRQEQANARDAAREKARLMLATAVNPYIDSMIERAGELAGELGKISADLAALHQMGSLPAFTIHIALRDAMQPLVTQRLTSRESSVNPEVAIALDMETVREFAGAGISRTLKHL